MAGELESKIFIIAKVEYNGKFVHIYYTDFFYKFRRDKL